MAMTMSSFYPSIPIIGALLGFCQGIVWSVLSVTVIVLHLCANYDVLVSYSQDSYSKILVKVMYTCFIKYDSPNSGMYIKPWVFFGFMVLYLMVNLTWTILSGYVYYVCTTNFVKKKVQHVLIWWSITSGAILFLDLILFSLLVRDYAFAIDAHDNLQEPTYKLPYLFVVMANGIMITIAARGFILWLINLVITVLIIKLIDLYPSNEVQSQSYGSSRIANLSDFPHQAHNPYGSNIPKRRSREAEAISISTSSTLRPYKVYHDTNYVYDPDIENRLRNYEISSSPRRYD